MKQNKLQVALLMLCGGMAFTSCHDTDMFDPASAAEKYAKNWVDKFGEINPDQDWNAAKAGSLVVNVAGSGSGYVARVYTGNPHAAGDVRLLARYDVNVGENNLKFDFPAGMTSVYVNLVGNEGFVGTQKVGIGETVSFDETRPSKARAKAATRAAEGSSWKWDNNYLTFKNEDIKEIVDSLPEEVSAENKFNNYEFISNGEFIIYPIYGQTWGSTGIGYYYYDPNDLDLTKIQNQKSQITNNILNGFGDNVILVTETYQKNGDEWELQSTSQKPYCYKPFIRPDETDTDNPERLLEKEIKLETEENGDTKIVRYIKSRGIAINVPTGYRVGFYSIQGGNDGLYSNQALNEDGKYYSAVKTNSKGDFFFGLEDWKYMPEGHDWHHVLDCNDIVFYVKPAVEKDKPVVITPDKPQEWIIACEDLGSTDDVDFNDVVFSVSHVSGNGFAFVKPLAAGGVYSATVGFTNNSTGKEEIIGEIHDLLGKSDEDGQQPMLNTGLNDGHVATAKKVDVPVDYSLAYDENNKTNMGGFYIQVKSSEHDVMTIAGPTLGEAPQMILIPNVDWRWPLERVNIEEAYPMFKDWSYKNINVEWYNSPADEKQLYNKR